jgi:hypothetical protein
MSMFSDFLDNLTGATQKKEADTANALNQQAISQSANSDAFKQKLITDRLGLANSLVGQYQPQANEWTNNYLSYLKNSPDLQYNAQRGQMDRGIQDAMNRAPAQAAAMGRSGGGLTNSLLSNLSYNRAGMLGNLEGQRQQNQGQRLGMGTQLLQGLLQNALNLGQSSAGMGITNQSQTPQLINQAATNQLYQSNMTNPIAQVGQNAIGQWLQNWLNPTASSGAKTNMTGSASGILSGINGLSGLANGIGSIFGLLS